MIIQEILYQEPLEIFYQFSHLPNVVFLDSAQLMKECAQYTFIAIDPFSTLVCRNNQTELNSKEILGHPFDILQNQLKKFELPFEKNLPPFQGGAAGFFSYDLLRFLEKVPLKNKNDYHFPDMALGFYDLVIGFDLFKKRTWIFSSGYPLKNKVAQMKRAKIRLNELLQKLNVKKNKPIPVFSINGKNILSNFDQKSYIKAIQKTKEYILAGDIFQANISQRFQTVLPNNVCAFDLYQKLRTIDPAPFSAYIHLADTVIASASPERFLKVNQKTVETRPIKGTKPRGKNPKEDQTLAKALLKSEKDQSENIMIVDLLRNDLSKVCDKESVKVATLCGLESYALVHHLVSVVKGKLKSNQDLVDLLKATFPGGSVTGAPKIRAMEIISELEPTLRGPYCGSLGYLGFNGEMDLAITIRSFCIKNQMITFQAGGAIVLDSDPLAEYEETLVKALGLKKVLVQ